MAMLPNATREGMVYLVVGRPGDCGEACIDHRGLLDELIREHGLQKQVLIISEFLSKVGGGNWLLPLA